MKIIEINCCFECPYCSEDKFGNNPFCESMHRFTEEKSELCPPSWCPLPDDSQQAVKADAESRCEFCGETSCKNAECEDDY